MICELPWLQTWTHDRCRVAVCFSHLLVEHAVLQDVNACFEYHISSTARDNNMSRDDERMNNNGLEALSVEGAVV